MNLKGWRTFLANVAMVATLAVQNQTVMNMFSTSRQVEILSVEGAVMAIVNIILRLNTTTPPGQPPASGV